MIPLAVGVLIIAIIVIGAVVYMNNDWRRENNISYVFGVNAPQGGSGNGNVSRLGVYDTQDACEQKCEDTEWCRGYSWYDGSGGSYANVCYGMKNIGKRTPQTGVFSGERIDEGFTDPVYLNARAGQLTNMFSNNLQHRVGMDNAY